MTRGNAQGGITSGFNIDSGDTATIRDFAKRGIKLIGARANLSDRGVDHMKGVLAGQHGVESAEMIVAIAIDACRKKTREGINLTLFFLPRPETKNDMSRSRGRVNHGAQSGAAM